MSVQTPPLTANQKIWNAWVPSTLQTDGPYGWYVNKVHSAVGLGRDFIAYNVDWVKSFTGAKTVLIKFPEAVIKISNRFSASTALPARMLHFFAFYIRPIVYGVGCDKPGLVDAKPLLAIADTINKRDFYAPRKNPKCFEYVVLCEDKKSYKKETYTYETWEWVSGYGKNASDWLLSVSESYAFIRAVFNIKGPSSMDSIAKWSGRFISIQALSTESYFLYKTLWTRQMNGAKENSSAEQAAVEKNTVATEVIIGSIFKIALSIVGISMDIFNHMARKETKPYWLAPAMFWASLAPTFLVPTAYFYWNSLIVEPLIQKPKTV